MNEKLYLDTLKKPEEEPKEEKPKDLIAKEIIKIAKGDAFLDYFPLEEAPRMAEQPKEQKPKRTIQQVWDEMYKDYF